MWSVQTTDPPKRYTITGAPRIVKGKVIIGNGGGEMGVRGFVSAYDAATGKMAVALLYGAGQSGRRFRNAATRTRREDLVRRVVEVRRRRHGLGFDGLRSRTRPAVHRRRQRQPMESPDPLERRRRQSVSLLGRRVAAGYRQYVWHFQSTPAESWDFTATQHIILADLHDRWQFAQGADAGAEERLLLCDRPRHRRIHLREELRQRHLDVRTRSEDRSAGERSGARYLREPAMVAPGPLGAHNWFPMSYSELTRLVYIPALESSSFYKHDDKFQFHDRTWNTGVSMFRGEANPQTVEAAARARQARSCLRGIPLRNAKSGACPMSAQATAACCPPAAIWCFRAPPTAI